MNSGSVLALRPSDNLFRTRELLDFEEDFVEKDPTGRYIRVCMHFYVFVAIIYILLLILLVIIYFD